jgi:hypothetical protein
LVSSREFDIVFILVQWCCPILFSNATHKFFLWSFPDPVPRALGNWNP